MFGSRGRPWPGLRAWVMWTCLVLQAAPAVATTPAPLAADGPPEPSAVVRRMVERARRQSQDTNAPIWRFEKASVLETLAADGTVRHAREKVYEVTLRGGMTWNRLIQVEGRDLTEAESASLTEKERRWRDRYSAGRSGSSVERMADLINEDLFSRFVLTSAGRDTVDGRTCDVLDFAPRTGDLPEERLIDRVINLLHGRLWVDAGESEVVRAEVRTEGVLRLWGGFLGALESFRFRLERTPGDEGVWRNRQAEVTVHARRLWSPLRVRLRETARGPLAQVTAPAAPMNLSAGVRALP